jgi:hypothetical protein
MRLERYLLDESFSSIINNVINKFSKMEPKEIKYQMKSGWYDFVDRIRANGNEQEMVDFINKTFHQNIKSLDDVNLNKIKMSIAPSESTVSEVVVTRVFTPQELEKIKELVGQGDPIMIGMLVVFAVMVLVSTYMMIDITFGQGIRNFFNRIFK